MIITDTLNGRTVEDVRRNLDGSVSFFCDSGHSITLHVWAGVIAPKPPDIVLPGEIPPPVITDLQRLRMADAFLGYMVNYVTFDDDGFLHFQCEPLRSINVQYAKAIGHREITVTHSGGLIDELPRVHAVIGLPSLSMTGDMGS